MKDIRGFTIFEVLIATAVMIVATVASLNGLAARTEASIAREEDRLLQGLADAIQLSFDSQDMNNVNVSALVGTIAVGETATQFDADVNAAPERPTTTGAEWYSRVARLRGVRPRIGEAINAASQAGLLSIVRNQRGRSRVLVAAPSETGIQRYLLLSLLTPDSRPLVIPPYDGTPEWFDEISNFDWKAANDVPPGWQARLTAAQLAAWRSASTGRTNQVSRLRVAVITQPKYVYAINNLSPTETAWLDVGAVTAVLTSPPNTGSRYSPEILAGRWVKVRRGTAAPGEVRVSIPMRSPQGYSVH